MQLKLRLLSLLSDLSYVSVLERFGQRISKRVVWGGPSKENKIALTFDDAPNPTYTPQLLKILNRFNVPATFFLIGKYIKNHFDLGQEITDEIKRTDEMLRRLNGHVPKFLRPPMGLFSKRVLNVVKQQGYKAVLGDVYPRDPYMPGQQKILQRVLKRVSKGSIIILHDGGNSKHVDRSQTIWAVERFIPKLQEKGFEFVTLSGLLH